MMYRKSPSQPTHKEDSKMKMTISILSARGLVAAIMAAGMSSVSAQSDPIIDTRPVVSDGGDDPRTVSGMSGGHRKLVASIHPFEQEKNVKGAVTFASEGTGVQVTGKIQGLDPNKRYEISIRQYGDTQAKDSAGDRFTSGNMASGGSSAGAGGTAGTSGTGSRSGSSGGGTSGSESTAGGGSGSTTAGGGMSGSSSGGGTSGAGSTAGGGSGSTAGGGSGGGTSTNGGTSGSKSLSDLGTVTADSSGVALIEKTISGASLAPNSAGIVGRAVLVVPVEGQQAASDRAIAAGVIGIARAD